MASKRDLGHPLDTDNTDNTGDKNDGFRTNARTYG